MPNVKVVIGANFGDEGKGLMTDYFCAEAINRKQNCIVVLSNGGAQRGHTVVTPDGIRHVFHHFGSGTLAGAATYLGSKYILNPMTFRKEYEELEAMGFTPVVYADSNCMWSTPYDMIANQIIEDNRGDNRHGSCGMGIWETILRYESNVLTEPLREFNELKTWTQVSLLKCVRERCLNKRLSGIDSKLIKEWEDILMSDNLIYKFIEDVKFMCSKIRCREDGYLQFWDNVIFENGQGLLLDQNQTKYGDNITPSNTGIKNPYYMIKRIMPNANVEVCYVTRTYMTRHGAGNFESECNKAEINSLMEDKTNVPNQYQGSMRYGWLNVKELVERIKKDISFTGKSGYEVSIAVTHINEFENEELLNMADFNVKYLSCKETREMMERK